MYMHSDALVDSCQLYLLAERFGLPPAPASVQELPPAGDDDELVISMLITMMMLMLMLLVFVLVLVLGYHLPEKKGLILCFLFIDLGTTRSGRSGF